MTVNETALNEFVQRFVGELGAYEPATGGVFALNTYTHDIGITSVPHHCVVAYDVTVTGSPVSRRSR